MDKPLDNIRTSTARATPKDFFLWAGAMIALYAGVVSFISLIFDYINYTFPDTALNYYYVDPYQGGVSYEMASLIVLAPVFLILMRVIRRNIISDPSRNEIWVRRWGLFLTVFLAGAVVVVDLIVLLTSFLNGEDLTVRFLLKVLVVLLVASAGVMHFMADLWGYWNKKPQYARYVNWAVAALVVVTVCSGFLIIGTPQSQRAYRIDEQRVNDLRQIQSQIVYSYYQPKRLLPASLDAINDPISGWIMPKDPETGVPYEYQATGPLMFELCATFTNESRNTQEGSLARPVTYPMSGGKGISENWQHEAGHVCFERTIDPQLYPAPANGKI